ncbi:Cyanate hydratase-like protein [Drosera capensis]
MAENKAALVETLLTLKRKSGKTYNQLAEETGLTNVYVGQLLRRQAHLKPDTAPKLKAALPGLTDEVIEQMMVPPLRGVTEGVMHFAESIKDIINEEFGDGIMSSVDFYCAVDKIKEGRKYAFKATGKVNVPGLALSETGSNLTSKPVEPVALQHLVPVYRVCVKFVYCFYPSAGREINNARCLELYICVLMWHFRPCHIIRWTAFVQ